MIGERIRLARKARGWSMRELARRVGVSAQAVSNYERGADTPSSSVLLRIARELDRPLEFFFSRGIAIAHIAPVSRQQLRYCERHKHLLEAHLRDVLERVTLLEQLIGNGLWEYPQGFPVTVSDEQQAEQCAMELRQVWRLGEAPVPNLTAVLEEHGICVVTAPAELSNLDGCAFRAHLQEPMGAVAPAIVFGSALPGDCQRFVLARELAYLLLEPLPHLRAELVAQRFAAALLAPASSVRTALGSCREHISLYELHLLKHLFGMSMTALILRARDLHILSERRAGEILRAFRTQGWHRREPGDEYPRESPQKLYRLVMRALEEGIISERRAEYLLGEQVSAFMSRIGEEHGGLTAVALGGHVGVD